ncbi:hypothetical protein RIF29_18614 [Crotalaria pallida]|uniref:Uncharacterized protein n=1 Tax=Crotalaria pallida TaxID=3830 RepID=A0AAN9EYH7_CROPI
MDYISELPDDIFRRIHLNFDVHNVLGSKEELLKLGYLHEVIEYYNDEEAVVKYLDWSLCGDKFIKLVDQSVNSFRGTKIDSFLVNFKLYHKQSSTIDQWINFSLSKGVERIDLLFDDGMPYVYNEHGDTVYNRYKLPFGIFSNFNASTTLKRLCLRVVEALKLENM